MLQLLKKSIIQHANYSKTDICIKKIIYINNLVKL